MKSINNYEITKSMYYVYSFIVSVILFIIFEWKRAKKKDASDRFDWKNIGNFVIMYVFVTFVFYFISIMFYKNNGDKEEVSKGFKKSSKRAGGGVLDEMMEYNILKKIPEDINTGFEYIRSDP